MGALFTKLRKVQGGWAFWCPGCKSSHIVYEGRWQWNGNPEKPTFKPSVLVTSGHHVQGYDGGGCWCDFNAELIAKGEEPCEFSCGICHTFITDGQIQYLSDCTHEYAGKTIPLPDFPGTQNEPI